MAPCYSYSHTKGAFVGLSIDGTVLATNHAANSKFYGHPVEAKDILAGAVRPPESPALAELYATLRRIDESANREKAGLPSYAAPAAEFPPR